MDERAASIEPWLVDLVRAFTPKQVPLDVAPDGTYQEYTTRWGVNPVYEAVPPEIRAVAEGAVPQDDPMPDGADACEGNHDSPRPALLYIVLTESRSASNGALVCRDCATAWWREVIRQATQDPKSFDSVEVTLAAPAA